MKINFPSATECIFLDIGCCQVYRLSKRPKWRWVDRNRVRPSTSTGERWILRWSSLFHLWAEALHARPSVAFHHKNVENVTAATSIPLETIAFIQTNIQRCCFSNVNYFDIMLTRNWSLSQRSCFQPHSKSEAWQLSTQLLNGLFSGLSSQRTETNESMAIRGSFGCHRLLWIFGGVDVWVNNSFYWKFKDCKEFHLIEMFSLL